MVGGWHKEVEQHQKKETSSFFRLVAVPQRADIEQATAQESWIRRRTCDCILDVKPPTPPPPGYQFSSARNLPGSASTTQKAQDTVMKYFTSSAPSYSKLIEGSLEAYLETCENDRFFEIKCSVSSSEFVRPSPTSNRLLLEMFDNPDVADTVFAVHRSNGEPQHIFASKAILVSTSDHFRMMFDSGFSEATQKRTLDPGTLATAAQDLEPSGEFIDAELEPFFHREDDTALEEPSADQSFDTSTVENGEVSEEPLKKRARLDTNEVTQSRTLRPFTVIDIRDTDFRTYRAMLAYLYTGIVPLLGLPVSFPVRIEQEVPDQPNPFNGEDFPAKWRQRSFDRRPGQAAYELFSPLSIDYPPVRDTVLSYVIENWGKVRDTRGFEIVIEKFSSGELTRGKDLMTRLLRTVPIPTIASPPQLFVPTLPSSGIAPKTR
ncbi:hypothetical protein JCM5350_004782 [Sporobolomyces pararoseus]